MLIDEDEIYQIEVDENTGIGYVICVADNEENFIFIIVCFRLWYNIKYVFIDYLFNYYSHFSIYEKRYVGVKKRNLFAK